MAVDATTALHDQVIDATADALAALAFGNGMEERVEKCKTYEDMVNVERPCLAVSLDDSRETCEPHTTEDDERVLPVMVTMLDRSDRKDRSDIPAWLSYRDTITRAFLMQLPEGVLQVWHVEVRPYDVLELERLKGAGYEDAVDGFLLLYRVVTPRRRVTAPADV